MGRFIVALLLFAFCHTSGYAFFEKDIRVLTMQNGLADNTVSCIHKDSDGFMWFGTDNGLSRYDGKNMKNFGPDNNYVKVSQIRETPNGFLWLIANQQIYCFDRRLERFVPIHYAGKKDEDTRVQDVLIQNDSSFWSLSYDNLSLVSVDYVKDKTGNIKEVSLKVEMEFASLVDEGTNFLAFCQSPDGVIYIGTDWGNILAFDPASYTVLNKGDLPKVKKIHINRLLYSEGYVWISTWANGAIRYNPVLDTYSQYTYDPKNKKNSLSHWDVYEIVPLSNGRYLTATWNGYAILIPDKEDPTQYSTEVYNNTASQLHRNLETRMISAYYDADGLLWIGTQGGGVYSSDLRKQFYQRFHQDTHNEICAMTTDKENHIWLATFHKGIMRSTEAFDPQHRLSFELVSNEAGNTVLSAITDKAGDLWFGNTNSELIRYHSTGKTFTVYPIRLSDNPAWNGSIWSLFVDSQERLWLGTSDGLLLFDKSSGQFTRYEVRPGIIRAITETPDKNLWLGTTFGLKKFNPEKENLQADFEKEADIPAREIRALFASSDKNLYIGYTDGFGVLDVESNRIDTFYTTHDGLSSNFIGCISEDTKGHLWLGSSSSVCRYSKHQKLFYNYYISGNNRSVMLYHDYLFWGNNKNMTYFTSEDVMDEHPVPDKVVITQIEVDNKPVEIGEKINDQVILTEGVPYVHNLILSGMNNSFSLLFSNLTYSETLQKYSYRLAPYQSEWLISGEGEKISYTNLPEGEYLFEVKSIFPDGSSGDVTSFAIRILPHWYETVWFRLIVFIFVVLALYYWMRRVKIQQARLRKEERLKHELFVANLEREKEKQINRERENFFTNVSHELRTPLTLILSPLQELLQADRLSQTMYEKLSLVYKNASSLSTLVNQLLYVQKIEAGMVQLHLSEVDIVDLVKKVMESFKHMAEIKNTEFILDSGIRSLDLWIDSGKIESALRNLLSNAFKYTSSNGKISVSLSEKELDGIKYCLLSVADNGPGIAEELQEHIFDSFITGKNEPSFSTRMGIGLRIVKNTMDMHHGNVLLESSPDKGTEFTLYIPCGKEHFRDDHYELIEKTQEPDGKETYFDVEKQSEPSQPNSGKKLLIVEDNDEIRGYINTLFSKEYQVLEAHNGKEGVETTITEIPDLIVSDIMMPVMDGFACVQEIRQHLQTAHIPVIMLTAKAEEEDLLKSTRMGADDYVMKPFNPEVLKAKVENLIRMREQLKRIYTKTLMLKHTAEEPEEEGKDPFMQQVINIIEANLTNPDFSAKALAGFLNISQPTLYRKIKQQSNLSIIEVIRSIRISKAASLIMQRKYSVQEVAEMVGYNDITTFRKHFTNQFGVSPSRYNAL